MQPGLDDETHMDYKYFAATVPRSQFALGYPLAQDIDPAVFAMAVRREEQVTLDASLEGKTLVFLFRCAGLRFVSAAVVQQVLEPWLPEPTRPRLGTSSATAAPGWHEL